MSEDINLQQLLNEAAMRRYEVSLDLVVHCPVNIIVEADDKQAAIDTAYSLVCGSVSEAIDNKNMGWKATLTVKPPKGVEIASATLKATTITAAAGGEKARKL